MSLIEQFSAARRRGDVRPYREAMHDAPDYPPGIQDVDVVPLEQEKGDGRTIVNYMWLNDVKTDPYSDDPLCGINLDNFVRLIENANRYPQAQFKLWMDSKLLDASSQYWVGAYLYEAGRNGNIELCDLQNIPAYAEEAVFAPENCVSSYLNRRGIPGCVYVRADCARALVMDYCLREYADKAQFVYYSDLDCKDLKLNEMTAICRKYGVVINDLGSDKVISHGYVGLDAKNNRIMQAFPRFIERALVDARKGSLGYLAFEWFLEGVYPSHMKAKPDMRVPVLPEIQYKMPRYPFFKSLGVN